MAESFRQWLAALPKAELHVHLEGAIPLPALWRLVRKYGGTAELRSEAELKARLRYPDFASFIAAWRWKNGFLREYEDFAFIAEAMARDFLRQNIRYAEVFFSPSHFAPRELAPQELAAAIRRGLAQVPEVEIWLIADLVRDHGPERARTTLGQIAEVLAEGVIGIGIGGSEQLYPPEPFAAVYQAARRFGLRTTAHAGEAAGAASVRGAVESLQVERIGHGLRAEEDPALLELLVTRQIPLELCPLSNLATGVIGEIARHPVRRYFEQGLLVTVNTDDPGMFHNSLVEEFSVLHEVFGFGPSEIQGLILNAIEAAWLPEARRTALRQSFTADPAWDRAPS